MFTYNDDEHDMAHQYYATLMMDEYSRHGLTVRTEQLFNVIYEGKPF